MFNRFCELSAMYKCSLENCGIEGNGGKPQLSTLDVHGDHCLMEAFICYCDQMYCNFINIHSFSSRNMRQRLFQETDYYSSWKKISQI